MSWRTIGRSNDQEINVEAASQRNVCNIVYIEHNLYNLGRGTRPEGIILDPECDPCYVLRLYMSMVIGGVCRSVPVLYTESPLSVLRPKL